MLDLFFDSLQDKMTLAKSVECVVPKNSSCMTVSLQQEAFLLGLASLGSTLWKDTGFREQFIVSAAKLHKFLKNCMP